VAHAAKDLPTGSYLVSAGVAVRSLGFAELEKRLVEAMRNASESK